MHKLKYPKTNSTAKIGVDFIRSIVNYNNCIFHEINADNDLGIDAMIEIIKVLMEYSFIWTLMSVKKEKKSNLIGLYYL